MDVSPHTIITDLTIDVDIAEATAIYQEIEELFKAANLDGPDAARSAFPNLLSLYQQVHVYVNNKPADSNAP